MSHFYPKDTVWGGISHTRDSLSEAVRDILKKSKVKDRNCDDQTHLVMLYVGNDFAVQIETTKKLMLHFY